jgi:subtilisin family serine protease
MCQNDADYTMVFGPRYAMLELEERWERLPTVQRFELREVLVIDLSHAERGGYRFLEAESPAIAIVPHVAGAGIDLAAQLQTDLLVAGPSQDLSQLMCEPGYRFVGAQGGPSVALDSGKITTGVQSAPAVSASERAQGSRVALLDTGLQGGPNNMVDFLGAKVATVSPNDEHGHGTAVAKLIAAVSQSADIYPVRVLGDFNKGEAYEVLGGLAYALWSQEFDIINASLVTQTTGMLCPSSLGRCVEYLLALCRANSKGALPLLVAAAGNNSGDLLGYPAKLPGAIVVTAVDAQGYPANYNPAVPSTAMQKSAYGGNSSDLFGTVSYPHDPQRSSESLWGTSMSAGIVTGAYLP